MRTKTPWGMRAPRVLNLSGLLRNSTTSFSSSFSSSSPATSATVSYTHLLRTTSLMWLSHIPHIIPSTLRIVSTIVVPSIPVSYTHLYTCRFQHLTALPGGIHDHPALRLCLLCGGWGTFPHHSGTAQDEDVYKRQEVNRPISGPAMVRQSRVPMAMIPALRPSVRL